jgi:hypothetical protein
MAQTPPGIIVIPQEPSAERLSSRTKTEEIRRVFHVFHKSIHRNLIILAKTALTSFTELFNFTPVDG